MNKHTAFLFALLIFSSSTILRSQDNVLLKGFVLDADNKEPLALAAIQVKNSQLGALAEDNGYFELPIPRTNIKDSLRISFVGYTQISVSVTNYKAGDTLRILLSSAMVTTAEAEIVSYTAKTILLKAIQNMRKNFNKDSVIQTGFYRQYHKENGKYVRLIEADVSVAMNVKSPYRYSFHESVQTNKERRSESYETNGDVHGDHLVDLLKENPMSYNQNNFLDPKKLDFYSPKFETEEGPEFIIKVQYKESSSTKLENARIWVEKETFAITQIEVEKFPNPYYKKTRYANDSRWKLVNEKDVIELEKINGKFFVSSITRVYNHHVLNRVTGVVDFIVEEAFDFYFYNYETQNVGEKMSKGNYSAFTNLYSSKYKYDEKFWSSYKPLNEYELDEQIQKDLEHNKKLKEQFVEMGK
jgi:hypothetical protein